MYTSESDIVQTQWAERAIIACDIFAALQCLSVYWSVATHRTDFIIVLLLGCAFVMTINRSVLVFVNGWFSIAECSFCSQWMKKSWARLPLQHFLCWSWELYGYRSIKSSTQTVKCNECMDEFWDRRARIENRHLIHQTNLKTFVLLFTSTKQFLGTMNPLMYCQI